MKMILVSNDNIAAAMKDSLASYFSEPVVETFGFTYENQNAMKDMLREYLVKSLLDDTKETFVILTDREDSAATLETKIIIHDLGIEEKCLVLPGMSQPLLIKLYGLMDTVDLDYCRDICENPLVAAG